MKSLNSLSQHGPLRWQFTRWLVALVAIFGCGGEPELAIVQGIVRVGGETPDSGEIRFVPLADTPGSVNAAVIVGGQYQIAGRGGVAVGKYRVEIMAKKKTGRQVEAYNGFEVAKVDEEVLMHAPIYATAQSPLAHDVTAADTGQTDFDLPAEPQGRQ